MRATVGEGAVDAVGETVSNDRAPSRETKSSVRVREKVAVEAVCGFRSA